MPIGLPKIVVSSKPIKWAIENNLRGLFSEIRFAVQINKEIKELLKEEIIEKTPCPIIVITFLKEFLWQSVKGVITWELTSLKKFPQKVEEAKKGIKERSSWTGGYFNYLYEQLKYLSTHSP